jgi:hypothetical protein
VERFGEGCGEHGRAKIVLYDTNEAREFFVSLRGKKSGPREQGHLEGS